MIGKIIGKTSVLYILYFLFLWGGQFSSAFAARQDSGLNVFLIPLYFCFFSRAVIWFLILRRMALVTAYTLSSINFLIIPFLSLFILGEPLLLKHLLGGLCIVTGIVLYGAGEQKQIILFPGNKAL